MAEIGKAREKARKISSLGQLCVDHEARWLVVAQERQGVIMPTCKGGLEIISVSELIEFNFYYKQKV